MSNPSVAYRHPDMPVTLNGTFVRRVQDFSVNADYPHVYVDELGRELPVGLDDDTERFRANMRWFPINNEVEELLAGVVAGTPVKLVDLLNMPDATLQSTTIGIGGARMTRLEYNFATRAEAVANITLMGNQVLSGATITVPAVSGVAAYRGRDVYVTIGTTSLVRAQSVTITVDFTADQPEELSNPQVIGTIVDTPRITATITWLESTLQAGASRLTLSAPQDMVITLGNTTGSKRITLYRMVTTGEGVRGQVRGYGTRTLTYTCDISTTDGMLIDLVP